MTCPACEKAQTDPRPGMFHSNCRGCQIRALASGPQFFDARQARDITPAYQGALIKLFGEDWETAHQDVKREFKRLQSLKGGRP